MIAKKGNGRPCTLRNEIAGRNLRRALLVLGKHWRKNTEDTGHVLKWDRWLAYGLPRSSNTIDAHMRLGIPEERLADYARCLDISPQTLADPAADMLVALGRAPEASCVGNLPLDFGYGEVFQKKYLEHNSSEYVQALFSLLNGVYIVQYITPTLESILQCSFYIYAADKHMLRGRGLFYIFGLDNITEANIFRWHNNLHSIFHCHNMMEFGHYLVIDPLRHHIVSRRDPFWLKGKGVTDNGQANNAPTYFTFRMEKRDPPPGIPLDAYFERECDALRGRPTIMPEDADYQTTKQLIEASDDI